MMSVPNDRYYVDTHEWALIDGDTILVGITDYAQEQLGDLVFVGDFKTDQALGAGDTVCMVESVKAASDIYAPVAGTVVAINDAVVNDPESIQKEPYEAWLFRLRPDDIDAVQKLLSAKQYEDGIS